MDDFNAVILKGNMRACSVDKETDDRNEQDRSVVVTESLLTDSKATVVHGETRLESSEMVEKAPIVPKVSGTANGKAKHGIERQANSRSYQCTVEGCGKAFYRMEHLTRHIRTHTGERPYSCTHPGCWKRFSRTDELKRHNKIHLKDTPTPSTQSSAQSLPAPFSRPTLHERALLIPNVPISPVPKNDIWLLAEVATAATEDGSQVDSDNLKRSGHPANIRFLLNN